LWIDADTHLTQYISVGFTLPEIEYDTLLLTTSQLEEGYYYAPADTILHEAGTYLWEILAYNECTRLIELYLEEKDDTLTQLNTIPLDATTQPKMVMKEGRVYLLVGNKKYTVLGEEIKGEI
jgi:hypothetical protein